MRSLKFLVYQLVGGADEWVSRPYITLAKPLIRALVLGLVRYALFNIATTLPVERPLLLEREWRSAAAYLNNYSLIQRSVRFSSTGRASGLVVCCVYCRAHTPYIGLPLCQGAV